jgi:hypothetical protein
VTGTWLIELAGRAFAQAETETDFERIYQEMQTDDLVDTYIPQPSEEGWHVPPKEELT